MWFLVVKGLVSQLSDLGEEPYDKVQGVCAHTRK